MNVKQIVINKKEIGYESHVSIRTPKKTLDALHIVARKRGLNLQKLFEGLIERCLNE